MPKDSPQKVAGDQSEQSHAERDRYKDGETGHFADPISRSELATTITPSLVLRSTNIELDEPNVPPS